MGGFLSSFEAGFTGLGALGEAVLLSTVARGPVPRDLSNKTKTSAARRPRPFAVKTGAWRGTGPRLTVKGATKHGEGQALALR